MNLDGRFCDAELGAMTLLAGLRPNGAGSISPGERTGREALVSFDRYHLVFPIKNERQDCPGQDRLAEHHQFEGFDKGSKVRPMNR